MRKSSLLWSRSMMRASLLLTLIFAAACGSSSDDRRIVDARTDAPGDGSASMAALDPHPHDNKLELLVAGLSVVVVLGPVHGARKRRNSV
jgi:hypothetical protein